MAQPAERLEVLGVYRAAQYDPTRTLTLRNAFASKMAGKFRKLAAAISKAVVERDCFGLSGASLLTQADPVLPARGQFAFPRSADKVAAFMAWLRRQEDGGILETRWMPQLGTSIEQPWMNLYLFDTYRRAVQRARYELAHAGYAVPSLEAGGGIMAALSTPFHVDRMGLVFTRAYSELQGITAAMDSQIGRILAQGIADGEGPRALARLMARTVTGPSGDLGLADRLGRFIPAARRAEILARTETIRAYAEATLQEYENWKVEGVLVRAELVTAGDRRVCPICASMHGRTYTIREARGVIPVHPQCRCCWVPLDVTGRETG